MSPTHTSALLPYLLSHVRDRLLRKPHVRRLPCLPKSLVHCRYRITLQLVLECDGERDRLATALAVVWIGPCPCGDRWSPSAGVEIEIALVARKDEEVVALRAWSGRQEEVSAASTTWADACTVYPGARQRSLP